MATVTEISAPPLPSAEVADVTASAPEGKKRKTLAEIEAEDQKNKEAKQRRERQRRGIYTSLVDALQSDSKVQEQRRKFFLGKTRVLTIPVELAGEDGTMRQVDVTVSGGSNVSKDKRGSLKVILPGKETFVIQSWDDKTTHAAVNGKGLKGHDAGQSELDELDMIAKAFNAKHQPVNRETPAHEAAPAQADQRDALVEAA